MSNLRFGMFRLRGLVDKRTVDFQGFQTDSSNPPDIATEATHHAQEKVMGGRRASGATTSVVET